MRTKLANGDAAAVVPRGHVDTETGELVPWPAPDSQVDIGKALDRYRSVQEQLDDRLPDCVQVIQGKQFRKKSYWRAVAVAFQVSVEIVDERRELLGDDVVWFATARATAPGGRSMSGDGACALSEKRGAMRTEHNVRSHALTRAKNRAISDLVGFGEVSAEEVVFDPDERQSRGPDRLPPPTKRARQALEAMHGQAHAGEQAVEHVPDAKLTDVQVAGLQRELARWGREERDLLAYLERDSVWSITQAERADAWRWMRDDALHETSTEKRP